MNDYQCPELNKLIEHDTNDVCENFECKHNVFYASPQRNYTNVSKELKNCMCLLHKELSLREIGEMYGLSRERIRQIELKAIHKFIQQMLKNSELSEILTEQQIRKGKRLLIEISRKLYPEKNKP